MYKEKMNLSGLKWPFSFSIFMHHSCHAARYVKNKRLHADGCEISSSETQLHMCLVEELLLFDTHWAQLQFSPSNSFITKLIIYFYSKRNSNTLQKWFCCKCRPSTFRRKLWHSVTYSEGVKAGGRQHF